MSDFNLWVDQLISNRMLKDYLKSLNKFDEINESQNLVVDDGKVEVELTDLMQSFGKDIDEAKAYLVVLVNGNQYQIALIEKFIYETSELDMKDVVVKSTDEDELFLFNDGIVNRLAIWVGDNTESFLSAKTALAVNCNLYI